jgi:hypothetical protein
MSLHFLGGFEIERWPLIPLYLATNPKLKSVVSTHDQQTLPLQVKAMRQYARRRSWKVLACVLVGAFCGLINGELTVRFQLPSFIVTLGLLEAARGAAWLAKQLFQVQLFRDICRICKVQDRLQRNPNSDHHAWRYIAVLPSEVLK